MNNSHVFVSYARTDIDSARLLVTALRRQGLEVWIDTEELSAGSRWKQEIRQAIKGGSAVTVCLSTSAVTAKRSFVNEELTQAIEELRLRPWGLSWLFVVRFDACVIPDRPIGAGETLLDLQHFDLFPDLESRCEVFARHVYSSVRS